MEVYFVIHNRNLILMEQYIYHCFGIIWMGLVLVLGLVVVVVEEVGYLV